MKLVLLFSIIFPLAKVDIHAMQKPLFHRHCPQKPFDTNLALSSSKKIFEGETLLAMVNTLDSILLSHSQAVNKVCFSPDATCLLSCSTDKTIKICTLGKSRVTKTIKAPYPILTLSLFSKGKKIITGLSSGHLLVFDIFNGNIVKIIQAHNQDIVSTALSPDEMFVATGSTDNSIKIWDLRSGTLLKTINGHSGTVNSLSWSPDGNELASGSSDKSIKIWNIFSGKMLHTLLTHSYNITSVSYSPDGNRLAVASEDRTISLWNMKSKKLVKNICNHTDSVNEICWSPDGTMFASCSSDSSLKIWCVCNGSLIKAIDDNNIFGEHTYLSIAWSPDGKLLATGSTAGCITTWKLKKQFPEENIKISSCSLF